MWVWHKMPCIRCPSTQGLYAQGLHVSGLQELKHRGNNVRAPHCPDTVPYNSQASIINQYPAISCDEASLPPAPATAPPQRTPPRGAPTTPSPPPAPCAPLRQPPLPPQGLQRSHPRHCLPAQRPAPPQSPRLARGPPPASLRPGEEEVVVGGSGTSHGWSGSIMGCKYSMACSMS